MPRLGLGRRGRLEPIEGTLTAEDRERIGCALSPRCEFRQPQCDDAEIAMYAVGQDEQHVARCIRLDQIPARQVVSRRFVQPPGSDRYEGDEGDDRSPALLRIRALSKSYSLGGRYGVKKRAG